MAMRSDRVGSFQPRNFKLPTTPKQWLEAARSGKVSFEDVMEHLDTLPENVQEEVVAACNDKPGF